MLRLSISLISCSMLSGVIVVWLWMSMTGNFARGTMCGSATTVDFGR